MMKKTRQGPSTLQSAPVDPLAAAEKKPFREMVRKSSGYERSPPEKSSLIARSDESYELTRRAPKNSTRRHKLIWEVCAELNRRIRVGSYPGWFQVAVSMESDNIARAQSQNQEG